MNRWDRYVGVPFDVERKRGTDCWGLVRDIYRNELHIDLPDYAEINADELFAVARTMSADSICYPWSPVETPQIYDVVLMSGLSARSAKLPIHVGIMCAPRLMLHTSKDTQSSVIVPITSLTVRSRIRGFYRHELLTNPGCLPTASVLKGDHSSNCA